MGHVRSLSSSLDQNKKKLIYQFLLMGSGVLMELILSKYNFSFRLTCSLYPLSLSKFEVTLNSSFDFEKLSIFVTSLHYRSRNGLVC